MATHVYFSYGSTIKDPIRAAITHTSLFAELIAMTHLFSYRILAHRVYYLTFHASAVMYTLELQKLTYRFVKEILPMPHDRTDTRNI